jgi:hypothetical protein
MGYAAGTVDITEVLEKGKQTHEEIATYTNSVQITYA